MRVDQAQALLDVAGERDGGGVVEPGDRRAVELQQGLVRRHDVAGSDPWAWPAAIAAWSW